MKIEKGIPLPETYSGKTGMANIMRKMEIGDSVWCKAHVPNVHQTARRNGIRIATRTEGDGIRFWRIA